MTSRDADALRRCLLVALNDPDHRDRFLAQIEADGREEAERSAAYTVQYRAMRLKPWESPPCWAAPDGSSTNADCAALATRMIAAGLSRFEPDPLAALERATSRKPKPRGAAKSTGSGTENRNGRSRRFFRPV